MLASADAKSTLYSIARTLKELSHGFRDRAPYYVISSILAARIQVGSQNVIIKAIAHRGMCVI